MGTAKDMRSSSSLATFRIASTALLVGVALGGTCDAFAAELTEPGSFEFGLYSGALFVSNGHSLHSPALDQQAYATPVFEVGTRFGYYPLPYLGVEGDLSFGEGIFAKDLSDLDSRLVANRGNLYAYRAQLVGQLPDLPIVPYGLVGIGALGASSQVQGRNTDFLFHFGGGVKIPLKEGFALRAELRENLHNRTNDRYAGIAFSEEVNVGVVFHFGRGPGHGPLVDQDGDRLADHLDSCPTIASLAADGCPLDSDGDGVADQDDACPEESGTSENGCPDADADHDGVPLPCDLCPEESGVPPTGCVDEDPDKDNITGLADKCPQEPETYNGYDDADGCPDALPEEVEKFTGTIRGISFPQGRSTIQKSSEKALGDAADLLKKHPGIRLEISGHTSSEGDPEFNRKLSFNRAEAVRSWLIEVGIPPEQLEARGAGATEPMGDNATQEGREMNRRIEFRILGGAAQNGPSPKSSP